MPYINEEAYVGLDTAIDDTLKSLSDIFDEAVDLHCKVLESDFYDKKVIDAHKEHERAVSKLIIKLKAYRRALAVTEDVEVY